MTPPMSTPPTNDAQQAWRGRAAAVLPGAGFGNFDPSLIIAKGVGSRVKDVNGDEYVDYLLGSGPMMVGHANPRVIEAVERQLKDGFTFFANSTPGIELAEIICKAAPCAEQLRYVSTGGEADMYAMRLARAHTGRSKILKFEGGYHGMSSEALMSLAPTKLEAFPNPVPDSAGIPKEVAANVLAAPFNDLDYVEDLMAHEGEKVAGVIVEPLQRLIPPEPGFLEGLRALADRYGAVLIFDEVVTGFRLAWGGGQEAYGVTPDLATYGKVIGGGFPLAAIAGKKAIMDHFDKAIVGADRFTYQVGTLSGNPIASVAGLETLKILGEPGTYEGIRTYGQTVMNTLRAELERTGHDVQIVGDPSLFDVVFSDQSVVDYRGWLGGDGAKLAKMNKELRARGVLKAPSKFYVAPCHDADDLALTLEAITGAAEAMAIDKAA